MSEPKMTKYKVVVTAEGTIVCPQIRMIRPYSRITIVLNPTQRMADMLNCAGAAVFTATSITVPPRQARRLVPPAA